MPKSELMEDTRSMMEKIEAGMRDPAELQDILDEHGGREHYISTTTGFHRDKRNEWIKANHKGDYEATKLRVKELFGEALVVDIRQLRRILA